MRTSLATTIGTFLIAGLGFTACGEVTAPTTVTPDIEEGIDVITPSDTTSVGGTDTTSSDTTPPDTTVGSETDTTEAGVTIPAGTVRHAADAPPLAAYDTTFTVVQGEGNTFVLFYYDPWTTEGEWFMKIDIPSDAEFVNASGEPYAYGDTLAITAHVDSSYFFVQFGPHGSTFLGKKPAQLSFNAKHAELGGQDPAGLDVWYQPSVGFEWTPQETTVEKNGNRILIDIYHFSNYAVAW